MVERNKNIGADLLDDKTSQKDLLRKINDIKMRFFKALFHVIAL